MSYNLSISKNTIILSLSSTLLFACGGDGANRAPDAVNDSDTTYMNSPVTINVIANDTDPDGDDLTITSFIQGSNGTVTKDSNGKLVYTPAHGFTGPDTFDYTISDGHGGTDTATVTVTVKEASTTVKDYIGRWNFLPNCEDVSTTDPTTGNVTKGSIKAFLDIDGATARLDLTDYSASNNCTGARKHYEVEMSMLYGADVPNASSICSNTKKVDTKVTAMKVDGVKLSEEALALALKNDTVPALVSFGLLCTSPDGKRLYSGDDENGTKSGNSDATRPVKIDDTDWLVRARGVILL